MKVILSGAPLSSATVNTGAPLPVKEGLDLSSVDNVQPAKTKFAPKINEKGELDFSGPFKAHESVPLKMNYDKSANLEESAASVWLVKPDVKKSRSLGLSLQESRSCKDITRV